jgi:hypothetical protein
MDGPGGGAPGALRRKALKVLMEETQAVPAGRTDCNTPHEAAKL